MTPPDITEISTEQSLKAALQALQGWWGEMGVETPLLPPITKRTRKNNEVSKKPQSNSNAVPTPVQAIDVDNTRLEYLTKSAEQAKAAPTLEALKSIMNEFDAGTLSDSARTMVFARGNPQANIMIIGEMPSRSDDAEGFPFTGKNGTLLDKMLAAIGLDESKVYITTACNWRPPKDVDPNEQNLVMCAPFLTRHMELITPTLVIVIGSIALQALCGKTGITKARGNWHEVIIGGVTVPAMPIYPPKLLLDRPELKRDTWRDLLTIQSKLNEDATDKTEPNSNN